MIQVGDNILIPATGSFYSPVEKIEDGIVYYYGFGPNDPRRTPVGEFVPNTCATWSDIHHIGWGAFLIKSSEERKEILNGTWMVKDLNDEPI